MNYKICETCNKIFYLNPRLGLKWAEKTNRGRFCGRECYYKWRKGKRVSPNTEFTSNGISWNKHPRFVDGRWSYRKFLGSGCFHCNSKKNLCVHHKDGNNRNNELQNLRTVCAKCHHTIEHKHKFYGNQYTKEVINYYV